jgi:hypothetical protein
MDNCYDFKDNRVARLLSVLEDDPVASIRKDYLAVMKHGTRTTVTDYFKAEIFAGNFLSFNRYRSYSLKFIDQLLNYYIANSTKILHDMADAKGDSDAIKKVYIKINSEIKRA